MFASWFAPSSPASLALVRIVCCTLCFLIYLPLDIRPWSAVSPVFWMPVSLFHLLPGPPRSPELLGLLQTLWKISLASSAAGLFTHFSLFAATALGFFVLGLPNCFGKIHHLDGFIVLLLAILLLSRCADALALDRLFFRHPAAAQSGAYTWPLRLAQALFLLMFFAAGYAKLRQSGLAWLQPDNMRYLLLGNLFAHQPPTTWAISLARSSAFCSLAAGAVLLIELSALPAIAFAAWRGPVLLSLLGTQIGIALVMGIYFTPHLVGYALFFPWRRLHQKSHE